MGFLSSFVSERKSYDPLALWNEIMRAGRASKAGPTVNLDNAFRVSAFFACARVLSQGCAQVPFKLFREQEIAGLTKILPAKDHGLYDLLTTKPNDWQTSFEFRETLVLHACLGNAYVFKNMTIAGVSELILLNPGKMQPEQKKDYSISYKYTFDDGSQVIFPPEVIWHVRGPSWSGFAGIDMLAAAREALGLSIALEESHASLHANGVRPAGTYSIDGTLTKEQHKSLLERLKRESGGANMAGAPLILDRSAKWLQTAMTGVDAQHKETRDHQIDEVCRFMGVSPFMIFSTDKAPTYASAEQFQIQHVVHTLSPWYARLEQSADANLLTKKERASGLYTKFMAAGLLRGASKDRADYFSKALGSGGSPGWLTPDEVRMYEEMNPMGGDAAKLPADGRITTRLTDPNAPAPAPAA